MNITNPKWTHFCSRFRTLQNRTLYTPSAKRFLPHSGELLLEGDEPRSSFQLVSQSVRSSSVMHAKNSLTENANSYLESTEYLDADHPLVAALADKLTDGAESDVERIRAIYLYVRDLRYDVLESFCYLAAGQRSPTRVAE